MFEQGGDQGAEKVRECVSCGWSDRQRFDAPVKEISTRVNQTREEREREVQTVRIIE